MNFIKNRDKSKPFFAVASFPDPHHPFNPSREYADKYFVDNVQEPIGSSEDLVTRPEHYMKHFKGGWHRKGFIEPKVSSNLISSIDLFPTICEVAEIAIPEYVDGVSQYEHLQDISIKTRDKCLIEYRNGYGKNDISTRVLVTEDYKYVRYQNGECELTDMKKDPEERENVAQKVEYKEVVNKINALMLDEILSTEAKYPKQLCLA